MAVERDANVDIFDYVKRFRKDIVNHSAQRARVLADLVHQFPRLLKATTPDELLFCSGASGAIGTIDLNSNGAGGNLVLENVPLDKLTEILRILDEEVEFA